MKDKLLKVIIELTEKVGRLQKENEYLRIKLERVRDDHLFKRRVK